MSVKTTVTSESTALSVEVARGRVEVNTMVQLLGVKYHFESGLPAQAARDLGEALIAAADEVEANENDRGV